MSRSNQNPNKKMTHEEFVLMAIEALKEEKYGPGIHAVYSGFNEAFREYFNEDPVKAVNQLVQDGKVLIKPVRGGVRIYDPSDAPSYLTRQATTRTQQTLQRILRNK